MHRLLLALAVTGLGIASANAAGRVALVIGNGAYMHGSPLHTPANDAQALGGALRSVGFDVILGTDLTGDEMAAKMAQFTRALEDAELALLFYSGHGIQIDGRNYLVPIDARLETVLSVDAEAIGVDAVIGAIDDEARAAVVLIDACQTNPFVDQMSRGSMRSVAGANGRGGPSERPSVDSRPDREHRASLAARGLARFVDEGVGLLYGFASKAGARCNEGDGEYSPYAAALARSITIPSIEIHELMTEVNAEVASLTGGAQRPTYTSDLTDRIYLGGLVAPEIEIVMPQSVDGGLVALEEAVTVAGKVSGSPERLIVDGRMVEVGADGAFSTKVDLQGRNEISVLAFGRGGSTEQLLQFDRSLDAADIVGQGESYALVIGSEDYDDPRFPDLRFPLADVDAVSSELSGRFGFRTSLDVDGTEVSLILKNPTLRDIDRALSRLRAGLGPEDSLLIYYAGHGVWQEDLGLAAWLPSDAEADYMPSMFTSELLHRQLAGMKARKVLVVSDSCYAGRMMRGEILAGTDGEALTLAAQRRSRVFLAAGNTEPVPDGGGAGGQTSPFAAAFLDGLRRMDGDVFSAQQLFAQFIEPAISSADQEPVWSPIESTGHEGGDFVFVRTAAVEAGTP